MTIRIRLRSIILVVSMIAMLTFATPFVVNTNAMRIGEGKEQQLPPILNDSGVNPVFLPIVIAPLPNEAPTNVALSIASIPENKPVNTEIGTFSTTDPDSGNTFTYSLVSGTGSTDNASFHISGNRLLSSIVFDYETKNSYSIRVRTADQGGLYFEKIFTISVTDVYEDPPGVTIRPNHSWYVDSIDYLHIVGEVMNNTSANLRYVEITANLFNSSGTFLGSDFTYTYLSNLPAWQKTCFEIVFYPDTPVGWTDFTFEPVSYWTDGDPQPALTPYNHSGSYNATYGWYEIIGMVRNDGVVTYDYVQPIATLYNSTGTVVGCDFTFTNTYPLIPGQSSSFELTFIERDYADAAYYSLQVDGSTQ